METHLERSSEYNYTKMTLRQGARAVATAAIINEHEDNERKKKNKWMKQMVAG